VGIGRGVDKDGKTLKETNIENELAGYTEGSDKKRKV
jgi:hypothetical protein